jgi:MGT family glycosyltransferase
VAIVTFAAQGHINKSLAIASELVARGHRVTYPVSAQFAAQVQAAGAVPVHYRATINPEPSAAEWPAVTSGADALFLAETVMMLPQLAAAYQDDRPDLLLYKVGCWPGPILATTWGIPAVQFASTRIPRTGSRVERASFCERFERFLVGHGIDLSLPELSSRPDPCLVLLPRTLQAEADKVPDNCTFVGPCLQDRPWQGGWHPPDSRPVLLITLGSVFTDRPDLYRQCVAAFADEDWTVVMAIGSHVQPADLGRVPDNFEIRRSVPQLAVLAQARAFLSHCGMGGLVEALYHGVPIVGVPQAADQFENAARLAELGLGVHLPPAEVAADRLRAAVQRVSADAAMADRLAQLQREIRAQGGSPAAADLIERQLRAADQNDR